MPELIASSTIDDVVLVRPDVHGDERGRFVETYRRSWLPLGREMVQGNRSEKQAGAVVGLHYHLHQADYWYLLRGRARVVLHDLRQGSPTDGATELIDLDGDIDQGLFIPPGVAHGFAALTDLLLWYLVDSYYNDSDELGLAWDDPAVAADWGLTDPILSRAGQGQPPSGRDRRRGPTPNGHAHVTPPQHRTRSFLDGGDRVGRNRRNRRNRREDGAGARARRRSNARWSTQLQVAESARRSRFHAAIASC